MEKYCKISLIITLLIGILLPLFSQDWQYLGQSLPNMNETNPDTISKRLGSNEITYCYQDPSGNPGFKIYTIKFGYTFFVL